MINFGLLPPLAFNALLFIDAIDGVFSTLNELGFVVRIIIFSYLCYWLYITFRDVQTIFGVSIIITAYIIFIHSLSITLLTIIFFVFVVFGNMLQMILMFGVLPLLGYSWTMREAVKSPTSGEMASMQAAAMRKAEMGMALTEQEMQMLQGNQQMGAAAGAMPQQSEARLAGLMGS
ncbi:MAG: hypothetical protein V1817_02735 [Candidatus Micrarchaeota archaeon]